MNGDDGDDVDVNSSYRDRDRQPPSETGLPYVAQTQGVAHQHQEAEDEPAAPYEENLRTVNIQDMVV